MNIEKAKSVTENEMQEAIAQLNHAWFHLRQAVIVEDFAQLKETFLQLEKAQIDKDSIVGRSYFLKMID